MVVTTHGVLDPNSARVLGNALLDLIEGQGNLDVVVDVADLDLSDHLCLAALAPAASAAERRGGWLTFADPSETVTRGLMLADLAGAVLVSTDRRSRSLTPSRADASGNGARRAEMAQHPSGSGTTPTAINHNTQGAIR